MNEGWLEECNHRMEWMDRLRSALARDATTTSGIIVNYIFITNIITRGRGNGNRWSSRATGLDRHSIQMKTLFKQNPIMISRLKMFVLAYESCNYFLRSFLVKHNGLVAALFDGPPL